jgi:hypothetical protein
LETTALVFSIPESGGLKLFIEGRKPMGLFLIIKIFTGRLYHEPIEIVLQIGGVMDNNGTGVRE